MNIGFDSKRALFNNSGLGNYSRSTISLLSQFYPNENYFLFTGKKSPNIHQLSHNQTVIEPDSVFYTFFPSFWRSWGIFKQIKKQNLDIYHGLSNELPFSIKKTGVKSIVTIHDLIFLRFPEYYGFIDRQIYTFKFRRACKIAESIIAISETTKNDIISYFGIEPSKITVVYQTCNSAFKTLVNEQDKKQVREKYSLPDRFILYLGTIEKRKNVLSLIKAYIKEDIQVPLVIAGKPTAYLKEIKQYMLQIPVAKRIIFRHNIDTADLPSLYQSADLFVYPSVFEGFGIPILEAMYSGIPVITSTGSCFYETGGEAALYCNPFDIAEMGKCICSILNNGTLRKSMIEKGIIQSKKFDIEIVAANLMNVYNKVRK